MEADAPISNDSADRIALLEQQLAAARASREGLDSFLENASLVLNRLDRNGVILWANQPELDLLGYSRDEYVGRNIAEFHSSPATAGDFLRRLANNEVLRKYSACLRHKDGSLRFVEIDATTERSGPESHHARCFTRDITALRRREQRLVTQTGVARLLASASSFEEAAPDLLRLMATDLECRAAYLWIEEGGILRHTASWTADERKYRGFAEAADGLPCAGNIGLPSRIWLSREPQWVTELRADPMLPRAGRAAELGLRSGFGFPVLRGGQPCAVMEFFTSDIRVPDRDLLEIIASTGLQIGEFVERTETRRHLAEKEQSYRVLTETALDGIITIGGAGTILFANPPAASLFGYSREELAGASLVSIIPAIESSPPARRIVRLRGLHRDGHEFPIEVSFGEYKEASNHVIVAVIRDIAELSRIEEKLRQAAKLESLGVLAGGIAHDFNNLLTGILGNISLAGEMLTPDHPASFALANAMEASERASHLTRQMLAYAGKGKFVIEPTDVSELVRGISALVRTSIPKHVAVRLDLHDSLPLVDADRAQLQQLIMNLVINGAEAVPVERQGVVLVTTRLQHVKAPGEVGEGNYVAIAVQDNGCGMDEATKAKIFDPFFTTKFTGRGLGLAAALGIVRGHKGVLHLFSTPGHGSTFRVLLPVAINAVSAQASPHRAAQAVAGDGTILVVDDEEVVRKMAAESLSRRGYSVVTAENGRAGVDLFRRMHTELALVILDLTMPVMDGERALQYMRSIDPAVPILLSSGYNEADATMRFEGKGLAGFLQKPYTTGRLADMVHSVVTKPAVSDAASGG